MRGSCQPMCLTTVCDGDTPGSYLAKTAERAKTGGPGRYERPENLRKGENRRGQPPTKAKNRRKGENRRSQSPTKVKNKPGWVVEPGPAGQIRIATQRYSAVAALIFLSIENMMRAAMKQSAIRMVQLAMSGTLSQSIEGMELR